MLERDRREPDKPIGMGGTPRSHRFVLNFDEAIGQLAIGAVPIRVDADRLDVDALLVHHAYAVGAEHERRPAVLPAGRDVRALEHVVHFRKETVRVNVHDFDALPAIDISRRRAGAAAPA